MAKTNSKPLQAEEPPPLETIGAAPETTIEAPPAPAETADVVIPSPYLSEPMRMNLDPAVMAVASWEGRPPVIESKPDAEPESNPDFPLCDWRVSCRCPTPLVDHDLTVEARTEEEAKAKFFAHNGISGTDHPVRVQKLELASV